MSESRCTETCLCLKRLWEEQQLWLKFMTGRWRKLTTDLIRLFSIIQFSFLLFFGFGDWENILDGSPVHNNSHTPLIHTLTPSPISDNVHVFGPLAETNHEFSKKSQTRTQMVTTAAPLCLNMWSREIWFDAFIFMKSSCLRSFFFLLCCQSHGSFFVFLENTLKRKRLSKCYNFIENTN